LIKLREFVEEKGLTPVVNRVWRFENGAEAFQGHLLQGGTVIRINEA